jgi:hypothetical protein
MAMQSGWRYCSNCVSMFWDGDPNHKGWCLPKGSAGHQSAGFVFDLPYSQPNTANSMKNWRFCSTCYVLFLSQSNVKSACIQGGAHVPAGFDSFVLPHDLSVNPSVSQSLWRLCGRCGALFWDGSSNKGFCGHVGLPHAAVPGGPNFVIPHDVPPVLEINFPHIVFKSGVAADADTHLTFRQDGTYTFSGHFHDSGAASYDVSIAAAVKDSLNQAYVCVQSGHIGGLVDPANRTFPWDYTKQDARISDFWPNIVMGYSAQAHADISVNESALVSGVIDALGEVIKVFDGDGDGDQGSGPDLVPDYGGDEGDDE